ncbi:hypothetical protein ACIA59_17140 [Micromonospora haikouensis]|uniref:hypothetical protein n=1 Tax=Micromonospora haikouensis TaxID=686309 RepID=UPI00378BAFAA
MGGTPVSPAFDDSGYTTIVECSTPAPRNRHGGASRVTDPQHRSATGSEPPARSCSYAPIGPRFPPKAYPLRDQLTSHLYTLDTGPAELVGALFPRQRTAQLSALLRAADQLDADQGAETACEHLHRQYVTSARWMPGLAGPPDVVAEVMLTLAGSGALTFDFTTGTGSLLRMATDRALHNGPPGATPRRTMQGYALITLLRLWFVHLRARHAGHTSPPPVVHVGDSLLADALPDLRADVVVANFPFGTSS